MSKETVLGKALIGSEALGWKAAMVLGGSLFIAVAAQISVPMWPVPITLQTLAILIVGLTFGSRLGAVTLLAYLAEGGVPFALCIIRNNAEPYAPEVEVIAGLATAHWAADGFGFLIIGGDDLPFVGDLAAELQGRI